MTDSMIQVFSNSLGDEELRAVSAVFESKWLGKGHQCDAFETEFANSVRVPRLLLTNSCTSAIDIAVRALEIRPGDEVIISTVNFVACASAIIDAGAIPVFADVDPRTLNIVPAEIERLKTPKSKAVILLHYGGHPCPMDEIRAVCGDGIAIIEDSANSISSSYQGQMCGTLGDAGVFSFDAMKTLVMSDGGALVIRDDEAFERARCYRYLGLSSLSTSGIEGMRRKRSRWWEYDLDATSGRFISNDVLAAIGRAQLRKLPEFLARRERIWNYYQSELADLLNLVCPPEPLWNTRSSYYLYWVQLPYGRDELANYLLENGVYTTFRYYPLHLVNYFRYRESLPVAESISETTLNLPLHQNLTDQEVEKVVVLIKRYLALPRTRRTVS